MALSKGRIPRELYTGFLQPYYLYEKEHIGGPSLQVLDPSSLEFFCHRSQSKAMLEDLGSLEPLVDYSTVSNQQPSPSEPSNSSSSSGFTFACPNSRPKEPQSVLSFKAASDYSFCNVSMLSFEQESQNNHLRLGNGEDSGSWTDAILPTHQVLHNPKTRGDPRVAQEMNCFQATSGYGAAANGVKEHQTEEEFGWLYSEEKNDDILQASRAPDGGPQKRPCMGAADAPSSKRHSGAASNRKSKSKAVTSKDTQSIAAKNRRERISERLKVLQALVPNGTKVDLVTMLEKALNYVKFLQLQVKVLSTDEFWPAHGTGKAPEVAQVKEAIDAILFSHKERNFGAN